MYQSSILEYCSKSVEDACGVEQREIGRYPRYWDYTDDNRKTKKLIYEAPS